MKYIIPIIFGVFFSFFNFKIIYSDLKNKIIPNKYIINLLCLGILFHLYIFFFSEINLNYLFFFTQLFFSILTCFLLYYFGLWGAGDAKYLLVLSIFVLNSSVLVFIGNIAIIILIYLLLYSIYFYFGKCLIKKDYAKQLYQNIFLDLRDKFITSVKDSEGKIYKKRTLKIILNWFLIFLFIFLSFRLFRLMFFENIIGGKRENLGFLEKLMKNYHIYLWLIFFLILFIIRYFLRKIFLFFRNYIFSKFKKEYDKSNLFFPLLLFFILVSFIVFEYINDPYQIGKYLYKIFTFYIILYLIIKLLRYSYIITFQIAETYFLEINKLKVGEIVDKPYLTKIFGKQKCLGFGPENDGILSPNPGEYFQKIKNPINSETLKKIKQIYKITNNYHNKNKTPNFSEVNKIKVFYTFSFSPYIIGGFLLTIFFKNQIFLKINEFIISSIQSILH